MILFEGIVITYTFAAEANNNSKEYAECCTVFGKMKEVHVVTVETYHNQ